MHKSEEIGTNLITAILTIDGLVLTLGWALFDWTMPEAARKSILSYLRLGSFSILPSLVIDGAMQMQSREFDRPKWGLLQTSNFEVLQLEAVTAGMRLGGSWSPSWSDSSAHSPMSPCHDSPVQRAKVSS